jgi:hypothetical protein
MDELGDGLMEPLAADQISKIAARAAATASAAAAGTATVVGGAASAMVVGTTGLSFGAKIVITTVLAATLTGVGAVAGVLPDPLQQWVSDVARGIGIELPSGGVEVPPVLPDVTVPADLGDVTIPSVVPSITVPVVVP